MNREELEKMAKFLAIVFVLLCALIPLWIFPAHPAKNYTCKVIQKYKKLSINETRYFWLLEDSLKNVTEYSITAEEYYQGDTSSIKKITLEEIEYKILFGR